MKNTELTLFYRVITISLVLILLGLIVFIFTNELITLSDSFYGALLGSLITGSVAIFVFKLGEISKKREEENRIERNISLIIKRLVYVNFHFKVLIHNFNDRFGGNLNSPLSDTEKPYVESTIQKLKRLLDLLDSVDSNQLDEDILEKFYKYKLNLEFVYDEMTRLYYDYRDYNKIYGDPNYKYSIWRLFKQIEDDIRTFEEKIQ